MAAASSTKEVDYTKLRECHCPECRDIKKRGVYLPAAVALSPSQAARIRDIFAKSIFENFDIIKTLLDRFEDLVRTRWLKKTRKEREKILTNAWPDIPTNSVPEDHMLGMFLARKGLHHLRSSAVNRSREAYLCGFVNLADLCHGQTLFYFLEARARAPPSVFAGEDSWWSSILHDSHRSPETHKILFWGQDSAETYGRLVPIADIPPEMSGPDGQYLFGMSSGILILEVQQRAYEGLAKCIKAILGDVKAFQYLVESDAQARTLISPLTLDLFSELALLTEIHHHLVSFRPWSYQWSHNLATNGPPKDCHAVLYVLDSYRVNAHSAAENLIREFKVESPSEELFFYPINKRRTQKITSQLRGAEDRLDYLWKAADTVDLMKRCWQGLSAADRQTIPAIHALLCNYGYLKDRVLYRTPQWHNQLPSTSNTLRRSDKLEAEVQEHFHGLQIAPYNTEQEPLTVHREKIKTRGVPGPEAVVGPEIALQNAAVDTAQVDNKKQRFRVSQRAHKTLLVLFHDPLDNEPDVSELAWSDVLRAMNAMGFSAEKGWGSIWNFQPRPEMGLCRGITFHESHHSGQGGKMSVIAVRRLGRRLNRAYGWDSETFYVGAAE